MEAGGLYVCSAGGKASNLPSFKSAAADQQKLTAHLLPKLKLSEKPKPHFPQFTSPKTYPPTSLFLHFLVHFWAASRSSLPSLDHLRPGTELIHTHRRKGGGAWDAPYQGSWWQRMRSSKQLLLVAGSCCQRPKRQLHAVHSVSWTMPATGFARACLLCLVCCISDTSASSTQLV